MRRVTRMSRQEVAQLFSDRGPARLVLITCGDRNNLTGVYRTRIIVDATDAAAAADPAGQPRGGGGDGGGDRRDVGARRRSGRSPRRPATGCALWSSTAAATLCRPGVTSPSSVACPR